LLFTLSVGYSSTARADSFAVGDFITYGQEQWGDTPMPGNAAKVLVLNDDAIYASTLGVLEGGGLLGLVGSRRRRR
jgi:hypothetical protein